MKPKHSLRIIIVVLIAVWLIWSFIYQRTFPLNAPAASADAEPPLNAVQESAETAPDPRAETILAEAKALAVTPALGDRYADDHLAGLDALARLQDEYVVLGGSQGSFDQEMPPDLKGELASAWLQSGRKCSADLRACILRKASQPDRLAELGGEVCESAAYAVSQADTGENLDRLRGALEQADRTSCTTAMIQGLVDAGRSEDLGTILSNITDADQRLEGTRFAIERLRRKGAPESTAATLLNQRADDLAGTPARPDLLRLLAVEGQLGLGQKVMGDGGDDVWLDEMEVFRRDLAHWNHHDQATIIQQEIGKRYPRGYIGRAIRTPDRIGGWLGRVAGDAGRTSGNILTARSYEIRPTEWVRQGPTQEFREIDKLENEKEKRAALLNILAQPDPAPAVMRQEAALRLLALRKPPLDDTQTRELVLQQIRGGRLWAAAQLLDQIQDEELRLESAAQAVVDLGAGAD